MTITIEKKLRDFHFWGLAAENAKKLTYDELDLLEDHMGACTLEPWSATEINDMMAYDFENTCYWIDLDYEEVMARGE